MALRLSGRGGTTRRPPRQSPTHWPPACTKAQSAGADERGATGLISPRLGDGAPQRGLNDPSWAYVRPATLGSYGKLSIKAINGHSMFALLGASIRLRITIERPRKA